MKIKHLFLFATTIIFSCARKEKQPNFVFILVDDLGWADVKCNFPESFYETPNIDRMAEEGVRFTQAYSAHPVCSPTRAALMTGKHPNRVDITDFIPRSIRDGISDSIPPVGSIRIGRKDRPLLEPQIRHELGFEEITLAEKLRGKGYVNCFVGKWHLGQDEKFWPEFQGFDINIGGWSRGSPRGGYYSPYNNPRLEDGPEGEYLTDRLTSESIRFINENKDNPFLLYLSFYTVHTPIQASKKHIDKYLQKREVLGINEVPHIKEGDGWTKLVQEDAAYASMVSAMDENIGRILEALNETGLDDNTWVIFTSDNGGLSTRTAKNAPTSNWPLRSGKGWLYEGGIRVPLIIKGPGVSRPGYVSDQPVVSMDYFTTILNIAGVDHQKHDGENLLPILVDNKSIDRDILFFHYPHYHGSEWKPGSSIRKGDWKLIYFYEDERTELFNLAADPGEMIDIAATFPGKTMELKKMLDEKLSESSARFPQPNPDFNIE